MDPGRHAFLPCAEVKVEHECLPEALRAPPTASDIHGDLAATEDGLWLTVRCEEKTGSYFLPGVTEHQAGEQKGRGLSPWSGRSLPACEWALGTWPTPPGPRKDRSRPHWGRSPRASAALSSDPSVFCDRSSSGSQVAPDSGHGFRTGNIRVEKYQTMHWAG